MLYGLIVFSKKTRRQHLGGNVKVFRLKHSDIAIGLVAVLSAAQPLYVSAANELLEGMLKKRARDLKKVSLNCWVTVLNRKLSSVRYTITG